MATNVRFLKVFLDNTITTNSEEGLRLNEVARLYDELSLRRAAQDKALPVNFYPLIEMYCVFQDKNARMEQTGTARRIRGFGFKSNDIRRLVSIFVDGTGATPENLPTINQLFEPLIGLSDT